MIYSPTGKALKEYPYQIRTYYFRSPENDMATPCVNVSSETVCLPDLGVYCEPGKICYFPGDAILVERLVGNIAPQLRPVQRKCPSCGLLIGTADVCGEIVQWDHVAPCGLECVGRGDNRLSRDQSHSIDHCLACCWYYCPLCEGRGCQRCDNRGILQGFNL